MLNVGGPELLIILLVALIFLGPQRLPQVARQLGQAASSLRSLASGFQAELEAASRPDTDSMRLDGPTSTSEAIAKTQTRSVAGTEDPFEARGDDSTSGLAEAARKVQHDGKVKPVSPGGPQDLRSSEQPSADASSGGERSVAGGSGSADAADRAAPETDVEPGERE